MRFHEIESERDAAQWIFEVYNPFGYVEFVFDEDRDWWEKAEHGAVAYGTFSLPLHFGAAISTGGYWANLPPGMFARSLAVRKFASEIYFAAARNSWRLVQTIAPYFGNAALVSAPVVAATAGAIGYEKTVNQPLRDAHPGSSGTWFGPFASGFGSVV